MAERDGIDDAVDSVYALSRLAIMKWLFLNDPEIQRKSLLGWNVSCCPHAVRGIHDHGLVQYGHVVA